MGALGPGPPVTLQEAQATGGPVIAVALSWAVKTGGFVTMADGVWDPLWLPADPYRLAV